MGAPNGYFVASGEGRRPAVASDCDEAGGWGDVGEDGGDQRVSGTQNRDYG